MNVFTEASLVQEKLSRNAPLIPKAPPTRHESLFYRWETNQAIQILPSPTKINLDLEPKFPESTTYHNVYAKTQMQFVNSDENLDKTGKIRESVASLNSLLESSTLRRSKLKEFENDDDPVPAYTASALSLEITREDKDAFKEDAQIVMFPTMQRSHSDKLQRSTSQIYHDSQVNSRRKRLRHKTSGKRRLSLPVMKKNEMGDTFLLPDKLVYQALQNHEQLENYLDDLALLMHRQTHNDLSLKEKEIYQFLLSRQDAFEVVEAKLARDKINRLFPGWKTGNKIGSGAMGVVEVAIDPTTDKPLFAIKRAKSYEMTAGMHERQLYKCGIKLLTLIEHPNILRYYAGEIVDNTFVTYMEYCNEGSLTNKIYDGFANGECERPGISDEKIVRRYLGDIVKGLNYFHQHDVIHRDVKPENILIHDGVAKIGDLGAMRLQSRCCNESHGINILGSPSYLAPETITGNHNLGAVGAADIWSLGCCLYEMIMGEAPWIAIDNVWSLYFMVGTWATRAMASHTQMMSENNQTIPSNIPSRVRGYRGKNTLLRNRLLQRGKSAERGALATQKSETSKHDSTDDATITSNRVSVQSSVAGYDDIGVDVMSMQQHKKKIVNTENQQRFYLQQHQQTQKTLTLLQQNRENHGESPGVEHTSELKNSAATITNQVINVESNGNKSPSHTHEPIKMDANTPPQLTRSPSDFWHSSKPLNNPNEEAEKSSRNTSNHHRTVSASSRRWFSGDDEEKTNNGGKITREHKSLREGKEKERKGQLRTRRSLSIKSDKSGESTAYESDSGTFLSSLLPKRGRSKSKSRSSKGEEGNGEPSKHWGRRRASTIGHEPENKKKDKKAEVIPPVPRIPDQFVRLNPTSPPVTSPASARIQGEKEGKEDQSTFSLFPPQTTSGFGRSKSDRGEKNGKKKNVLNIKRFKSTNSLRTSQDNHQRNTPSPSSSSKQEHCVVRKTSSSAGRFGRKEKETENSTTVSPRKNSHSGAAVPKTPPFTHAAITHQKSSNALSLRRDVVMQPLAIRNANDMYYETCPWEADASPPEKEKETPKPTQPNTASQNASSDLPGYGQIPTDPKILETCPWEAFPTTPSLFIKPIQHRLQGGKLSSHPIFSFLPNFKPAITPALETPTPTARTPGEPSDYDTQSSRRSLTKSTSSMTKSTTSIKSKYQPIQIQPLDYFQNTINAKEGRAAKLADERKQLRSLMPMTSYLSKAPSHDQARVVKWMTDALNIPVVDTEIGEKTRPMSRESNGESDYEYHFDFAEYFAEITLPRRSASPRVYSRTSDYDDRVTFRSHSRITEEEFDEAAVFESYRLADGDGSSLNSEDTMDRQVANQNGGVDGEVDGSFDEDDERDSSVQFWAIGNPYYEKTTENHPLIELAKESGKFSPLALDFMILCLQWVPDNRPTAGQLLEHPFIKNYDVLY
ncbi:Suppressor of Sensor Kinase (SLN1) [Nowakowskiella sp. JEL0407]|nr:Suppressor of Sensor Kinase (SLN1) [Nowakowskiella sp. JEL0407]